MNQKNNNHLIQEIEKSLLSKSQTEIFNQSFTETEDVMEWEPSESEVVITLHNLRQDSSLLKHSGKTIIPSSLNKCGSSLDAVLHVIVDTNIFLSHLPTVEMLLNIGSSEKNIQIYIPWMVLQELDYMKTKNEKKNSIEILARKAALFLFEQIKKKNPRVRIQTLDEFKNCINLLSDENDDKILEWCLYLQKERQCKMILLSNDIMFCAKASASGVESMPKEEFIKNLPQMLDSTTPITQGNPVIESNNLVVVGKWEETHIVSGDKAYTFLSQFKQLMQASLTYVLEYEMKAVFGDLWQQIVIVKPPWSLEDIIRCIDKHWIAVFSYIYSKDFQQKFDYLSSLLKSGNCCASLQSQDQIKLIETGICILQFIHRRRKQLQPHLKNALVGLEALKSKDPLTDDLVLEIFTSLWDRFNTTCGAIADAVNVSHNLERGSSSPSFFYNQAVDALDVMLPLLGQMESVMSQFFLTAEPTNVISMEFSNCILHSMTQLELKSAISDSEALNCALRAFASDAKKRELMTNGLSQLRMYLNVLCNVSSQMSCRH